MGIAVIFWAHGAAPHRAIRLYLFRLWRKSIPLLSLARDMLDISCRLRQNCHFGSRPQSSFIATTTDIRHIYDGTSSHNTRSRYLIVTIKRLCPRCNGASSYSGGHLSRAHHSINMQK
jgi:hypothetical protein